MFNKGGAQKDIGLRVGRGGRFAYGAADLYVEHRSKEGIIIPETHKGRPALSDLVNAEHRTGLRAKGEPAPAKPKQARKPRTPKAVVAA